MPTKLPVPTVEVQRVTRFIIPAAVLLDALILGAGWAVAHATSSAGWGFVTVAIGFLLGIPTLDLLMRVIQRRQVATKMADSGKVDGDL
jgi:hypothetical protein